MRFSRLVGIAALATAPSLLHAQAATTGRPIGLGVSGGVSLPVSDLRDAVDAGFSVAGHVFIMPPALKVLNFRGDVSYDRWSFKNDAAASVDGHLSTLAVTANALIKLTSTGVFHPYLIGGGGWYSAKTSGSVAGVTFDSDRSNNFGLQGGVGLDFGLSGFSTFLEAKFVNVFNGSDDSGSTDGGSVTGNSSTRYIPITFGIRF